MDFLFRQHTTFAAMRLVESFDSNGMHMEYKDAQGVVFARVAKVYKKGGLFHLFNQDSNIHGEVKDAAGDLMLTTTCYRGDTKRDCKVEVHHPDGTLLGMLYEAPWGADFELPDGTLIGRARRPVRPDSEPVGEPPEVIHTFTDASEQVVGTCDRRYPPRTQAERDWLWEVMDLRVDRGTLIQVVTIAAPVEAVLHTFIFLFPALQYMRFFRFGY